MSFHDDLPEGQIHIIYDVTYADAAARDADTTWNGDSTNVGKTVFVTDVSTVFMLLTTTPSWFEFGGTSVSIDTIYNADAEVTGSRVVTAPSGRSIKLLSYNLTSSDFTLGADIDIENGEVDIEVFTGDGAGGTIALSRLLINTTIMQVLDQINSKGLEYAADYSAAGEVDDRWIPDKGWVASNVYQNALTFSTTTNTAALGLARVYMCDDTSAARTLTISSADIAAASATLPWVFEVSDTSGAAGTKGITIDTEGAETIGGAASIEICVDYGSVVLTCDGSNLFVRSTS